MTFASLARRSTVFFLRAPLTEPPTSAASWPARCPDNADGKDSPDLGDLAAAAEVARSGPGTSAEEEVADGRGGDFEDGPGYLAVGSQAHQLLQSSKSSPSANGEVVPSSSTWDAIGVAPRRRSSYSEGQGEPGWAYKGHCRSYSDTGLVQERSQGMGRKGC